MAKLFEEAPADVDRLPLEVKLKYREVATYPEKGFHFHVGRPLTEKGHVVGVDMTPEMREKARASAAHAGLENVEFVDGLAEPLPLAGASVDVVISNGVINLCPDKLGIYREVARVLKPGSMVADVVVQKPLPEDAVGDIDLWTG